jgi:hypothetical protein
MCFSHCLNWFFFFTFLFVFDGQLRGFSWWEEIGWMN